MTKLNVYLHIVMLKLKKYIHIALFLGFHIGFINNIIKHFSIFFIFSRVCISQTYQ